MNKPGGVLSARIKSGNNQRGRGLGKTYIKFLGRHLHRVVAEKMIGRDLKPGEVVHHLDGNIRNNCPKNLMVLKSQSEHAKIHFSNLSRISFLQTSLPIWKGISICGV